MTVMKIKLSKEDAQVLADNMVEYNKAQERSQIPPNSELKVGDGYIFEQFTRHPRGMILPAKSFTHIVDAGDDFFFMDIGRYCSIARGTRIVNGHHPLHSVTTNPYHYAEYYSNNLPADLRYAGPIEKFHRSYGRGVIGNDVWIGAHCIIRSGVRIGDGAVISSGSVVVKDVPPYAIVGGNPAGTIRSRFPAEIVERMLDIQWWRYSPQCFRDINMFDVTGFLDEMEKRKMAGDLVAFSPNRFKFSGGKLILVKDQNQSGFE